MAIVLEELKEAPRVKETTVTQGSGAITLAGPGAGFVSFIDGIGNHNSCFYYLLDGNETAWEMGVGEIINDTLTRGDVRASSNAGQAIDLSASVHQVFNAPVPGFHTTFDMQGGDILNCASIKRLESRHEQALNFSIKGIVPLLVGSFKLAAGTYLPVAKLGCPNPLHTASLLINKIQNTIATVSGRGDVGWREGDQFTLTDESDVEFYLVADDATATAILLGLKL